MSSQSLIVAHKEIVDHVRDTRSVISGALYALMGPAVVLLALLAKAQRGALESAQQPWAAMAAVFALMAAFTGAIAIATDLIAGERERRSLLPLLVTAFSRRHVIVGKWLAAGMFAVGGLLVSVLAFGMVLGAANMPRPTILSVVLMAPALIMLALLAAALEILISTVCRNTKEAQTYLSMLVFAAMGVAMWLAFRSDAAQGWWYFVPLLGQQRLLEMGFAGGASSFLQAAIVAIKAAVLTGSTAASTVLVLAAASSIFQRDEAVYGG